MNMYTHINDKQDLETKQEIMFHRFYLIRCHMKLMVESAIVFMVTWNVHMAESVGFLASDIYQHDWKGWLSRIHHHANFICRNVDLKIQNQPK